MALLLGGKGLSKRKGELAPDPLEATKEKLPPQPAGVHMAMGNIDLKNAQGTNIGTTAPVTQTYDNRVNTGGGVHIGGNVNVGAGGRFIGRDSHEQHTTTNQTLQIEQLFEPILQAAQGATPDKRAEAVATATELKAEATKAGQRDDSRMAKLVDKLVELAPGAVSAVASAFGTPLLAGLAGPVTKFMLDRIQHDRS